MDDINYQNDRRRETDLLNNLQDDLLVLENTWKKKKLHRKKVLKQFIEIIDSILDIARPELLERFDLVGTEFRNHVINVATSGLQLPENSWSMASELADLLKGYFIDGNISSANLDEWQSHWRAKAGPQGSPQPGPELQPGIDGLASSSEGGHTKQSPVQEETKMADTLQISAKELLQKAQEALLSGDGDGAKEFALKAAEVIGKIEAEEAKKKEKVVRGDLELAVHEEMEAEETFENLKREMVDRDEELAGLTSRLADAQESFDEQHRSCLKIKEEIEKTEAELTRLQEEHKRLREQFQEALPARDAAERECSRVKEQLEKLKPEIEVLTDSLAAAESQFEKACRKRAEKEAELEKLAEKIGA